MTLDFKDKKNNNQGGYFLIEGEGQQLKVDKRDLKWVSSGGHKHHYLPDFTDEWDKAIALTCAVRGCAHGRMQRKEGKEFMKWLEEHRAKS